MKTAQIVTIKPQDGVVEYQIVDGGILSHGHQLAIELTAEQTGVDLQMAVNADAEAKSLLT